MSKADKTMIGSSSKRARGNTLNLPEMLACPLGTKILTARSTFIPHLISPLPTCRRSHDLALACLPEPKPCMLGIHACRHRHGPECRRWGDCVRRREYD